jgi:hypothetical protein
MAGLLKVTNFCPLILRNVVHFAFLRGLVGILGADGVNKIFCLELKLSVEMCELVAGTSVVHEGALLDFVGTLIYNVALIGKH